MLLPSVSSRKWVLLARKVKAIIWMTGQCSVRGPTGWGTVRCGSSILPPRFCCLSQENNMVDPSVGKKRCMAWLSQARTTTGKPWKASSWNPVSCWRQKPTMRSSEPGGCEPVSPHSIHRHLLLLHPGIPATGVLGFGHVTLRWRWSAGNSDCVWRLQPFTVEVVVLSDLDLFFLSTRCVGEGAGAFTSSWLNRCWGSHPS